MDKITKSGRIKHTHIVHYIRYMTMHFKPQFFIGFQTGYAFSHQFYILMIIHISDRTTI